MAMNSEGLRVRCPKCGADGKEDITATWREKRYATVYARRSPRGGFWFLRDETFHVENGPDTYTCEKCNYSSRSERVWIEVE